MGSGDACPFVRAKHREDWNIPDPRDMNEFDFNNVRNLIEQQVKDLLKTLKTPFYQEQQPSQVVL